MGFEFDLQRWAFWCVMVISFIAVYFDVRIDWSSDDTINKIATNINGPETTRH
jgi:hypothetical protein